MKSQSLKVQELFVSLWFMPGCVTGPQAVTALILFSSCLQDQVDRADAFPQVLKKVIEWMKSKELGTKYKYCILTDG